MDNWEAVAKTRAKTCDCSYCRFFLAHIYPSPCALACPIWCEEHQTYHVDPCAVQLVEQS
jgi:hypothetical protein